jgi:hypothetical protein
VNANERSTSLERRSSRTSGARERAGGQRSSTESRKGSHAVNRIHTPTHHHLIRSSLEATEAVQGTGSEREGIRRFCGESGGNCEGNGDVKNQGSIASAIAVRIAARSARADDLDRSALPLVLPRCMQFDFLFRSSCK